MGPESIMGLAAEAAQNAFDAHGPEGCPAELAYEFLRQFKYEECEGSEEAAQRIWDDLGLSSQDMVLFRAAYAAAFDQLTAEATK